MVRGRASRVGAAIAAVLLLSGCREDDGRPGGSGASDGGGGAGAAGGGGSGGAGGGAGGAGAGPVEDTPASTAPRGAEASNAACSNGVDDDGNGYEDCDDTWCRQTMEVTVCGALENTEAKCSDGADSAESPKRASESAPDGPIDCADPDCAKSPHLDVCPARLYELGDAACQNGADDDGDGRADCEDLDCLHAGASSCPLGARKRVLFDDAHRQRAGNADWVVDMPGRHPWPTVPEGEWQWAGRLSAFGAALVQSDSFTVEVLPAATGRFTHGSQGSPQDLSSYDVLVVPEASAPFEDDESAALLAFVQAGGGLLLVIDHFESDRDANGWDSVLVWNDFFAKAGGGNPAASPFGFSAAELTYDQSGQIDNMNGNATTVIGDGAGHPVLAGPNGAVNRLGFFRGGVFTVHQGVNPGLKVLFHALPLGTSGYPTSPYVIAATVGQGRVVAVGDSAIMNDGTDSHGASNPGFDSWHESSEQNAALFLNAVAWLAGE